MVDGLRLPRTVPAAAAAADHNEPKYLQVMETLKMPKFHFLYLFKGKRAPVGLTVDLL